MTVVGRDLDLDPFPLGAACGTWLCFVLVPWDGFFSEDGCITDGLWHDRRLKNTDKFSVGGKFGFSVKCYLQKLGVLSREKR